MYLDCTKSNVCMNDMFISQLGMVVLGFYVVMHLPKTYNNFDLWFLCQFYVCVCVRACVCVCVLGIYLMSFNLTSNSLHLGIIFVTIRNNNTHKYLESRFATHIPHESHVHIFYLHLKYHYGSFITHGWY